jgi:hypothetical protein
MPATLIFQFLRAFSLKRGKRLYDTKRMSMAVTYSLVMRMCGFHTYLVDHHNMLATDSSSEKTVVVRKAPRTFWSCCLLVSQASTCSTRVRPTYPNTSNVGISWEPARGAVAERDRRQSIIGPDDGAVRRGAVVRSTIRRRDVSPHDCNLPSSNHSGE